MGPLPNSNDGYIKYGGIEAKYRAHSFAFSFSDRKS